MSAYCPFLVLLLSFIPVASFIAASAMLARQGCEGYFLGGVGGGRQSALFMALPLIQIYYLWVFIKYKFSPASLVTVKQASR